MKTSKHDDPPAAISSATSAIPVLEVSVIRSVITPISSSVVVPVIVTPLIVVMVAIVVISMVGFCKTDENDWTVTRQFSPKMQTVKYIH